jgi:H+/Cl- antiporter ClcA
MIICPKCNTDNPKDAIHCVKCGIRLKPNTVIGQSTYNRYAIISLVFGIIGFLVTIMFWIRISNVLSSGSDDYVFQSCILWGIGLVVSILGIVNSKQGLKSEKVNMSKVSSWLSRFVLVVLIIWVVILVVNGIEAFNRDVW